MHICRFSPAGAFALPAPHTHRYLQLHSDALFPQRFCMYLQRTPDSQPEWKPAPASTFTLSISARPASAAVWAAQSTKSNNLKKVFGERLQAAIDEMKAEREEMGEGFVEWTDVLPEGGILDFTAKHDRVCSHETWQE